MSEIGKDLFAAFINKGIAPPNVRRMIIDISYNNLVKVYYECFADEKVFEVDIAAALRRVDAISVNDVKA